MEQVSANAVGLLLCILFGGALTVGLTIADGLADFFRFRRWLAVVMSISFTRACCIPGCTREGTIRIPIGAARVDWVCPPHL